MQSISVYLNQRASNSGHEWRDEIDNALFRSQISYKTPTDLNELKSNLHDDIANHVDAVLSVGGDGTVNSIIQTLAGTDVGLLVVPGGTANDFAYSIGSSKNIKHISQTIRQNIRRKVDLISINGQFMVSNGGIGFAAEVANEINELRKKHPNFKKVMKLSGKNIYSLFLAKKLMLKSLEPYKFKIQTEKFNDIIYSPLVLINNQSTLGGAYLVAPNTLHNDGTFNLTIFKHTNRIELIQCLIKIFAGDYPSNDKNLLSFEVKEAKIELLDTDEEIPFFGDGEIFNTSRNWDIKLYPDFLTVFSPKDQVDMSNICTKVTLM
jgi:YegS/Rv2252/BmrU family lipid kinase